MVNAVGTANYYQSVLTDLLGAESQETAAQQQVSTGKMGDDLMGFGQNTRSLVATNTVKARVDGMVDQLNQLQVKVNLQQTALGQVSDLSNQLQQSLTNALSSGQGDGLMTDVQSDFSQVASALNTQYGADYLFSGGQSSTQPFTATSLADLTTQPTVDSFFQNGSLTPTSKIDDNTSIQTGFPASDVGKSLMSVFQSIQQFQQSASGNFGGSLTAAQQTFLQNAISQLATVTDAATQTTAQGGEIQSSIATAITSQTDRQTTLKNMQGDLTDVDMATAASNLTQAQTAVQASAQVFMTLKSMSLLNYLTGTTTA
jgi:flagellar hook-associated protein 3 FlgL